MIIRYWRILTVIISFALFPVPSHATPFGTADEAVAMVKRVQARFQRDGAERTFAAPGRRRRGKRAFLCASGTPVAFS